MQNIGGPKMLRKTIAFACVVTWSAAALATTTAYNGTARWWVNDYDSGHNVWAFTTPKGTETITFTSGGYEADGATWAAKTYGPVNKFTTNPLAGISHISGFSDLYGGPLGSYASASAYGQSFQAEGLIYGTNWQCSVTVQASGKAANVKGASFDSKAAADDPDYMSPSDFANVASGDSADVYIPVSIMAPDTNNPSGYSVSPTGSTGLSVSITTATTSYDLFDMTMDGSTGDATITPSPLGSSVSYYLQSSILDGPPDPTQTPPMSISQLESAIDSDFQNGQFADELDIGIVFSNMPVPTQFLSDGVSVAQIDIAASAEDSGVGVPEPGTLSMLAVCGALLGKRRQHCKARSN
jgi:hypothetical protein